MARGKRKGEVTQKEMVQTALQEKGSEAKPKEMQVFIKEKFGTDLPPNVISNYKSNLKRESGRGGKRGKRGRKPGAQFSDLEAVRGLVSKLGAEQVKKLVDVANMFA